LVRRVRFQGPLRAPAAGARYRSRLGDDAA
jgi:hypothetical protein